MASLKEIVFFRSETAGLIEGGEGIQKLTEKASIKKKQTTMDR